MNIANLNSFLKFGYFLDYENKDYHLDFSNIDKLQYRKCSEQELIDLGIKKFKGAIVKQFDTNEKHVVPLSGGLDSRAILAVLLECTEARNINTYTFGTPGTLDYDIGSSIANKVGTNHVNFPLTEFNYCMDELLDISKRVDHQTLLFLHPPIWEVDKLFGGSNIWSGTIIDVFFGRHTHERKSHDINEAMKNFFRENRFVESIEISNVKEVDFCRYLDFNEKIAAKIGYEHYLDLTNRQLKFVAPHVIMSGYKYKALFTDKDLVLFALSVDNKFHEDQYLYKKMLLKAYPKLFSLKTKSNYGLPLQANNLNVLTKRLAIKGKRLMRNISPQINDPDINYLNFDTAIRERDDLNKIFYENLMDLKIRNLVDWIEIDKIWKNHMNKHSNNSDALIALVSLEIHLKAQNK